MADTRDILTLPEAKKAVGRHSTDTTDDSILAGYVTAVSRLIDQTIGPTVAWTITAEMHDGLNPSGRALRSKIILDHRPVISVTTITENTGSGVTTLVAETSTVQPTDGWLADRYRADPTLYSGIVRRRSAGYDSHWPEGRQNVAVTYTAGRVQSTSLVDARIKRAAVLTLLNQWRDREPSVEPMGEYEVPRQSFPTFSLPNAARQLLLPEIGQNRVFGIA